MMIINERLLFIVLVFAAKYGSLSGLHYREKYVNLKIGYRKPGTFR